MFVVLFVIPVYWYKFNCSSTNSRHTWSTKHLEQADLLSYSNWCTFYFVCVCNSESSLNHRRNIPMPCKMQFKVSIGIMIQHQFETFEHLFSLLTYSNCPVYRDCQGTELLVSYWVLNHVLIEIFCMFWILMHCMSKPSDVCWLSLLFYWDCSCCVQKLGDSL